MSLARYIFLRFSVQWRATKLVMTSDQLMGPLPCAGVHVDGELVEVERMAHAAVEQHLHVLTGGAQRVAVLEVRIGLTVK